SSHATPTAQSGSKTSECVTPRWLRMYSTGPAKPATKSRAGAAHAKNPAATRRGIARGAAAGAIRRPSRAPDSACVRVSIATLDRNSGGALLALRVLDVHLRVGAVRGRLGVADVHREAHVGEHRAERREAEHDVVRAAAIAHQAEAPDLALQGAEPGADLEAELVQQRAAHFLFVHALRAEH